MTTIARVAYAYVQHGGRPPAMEVRTVDADLRTYLGGHVEDLLRRATSTTAPPARFVDAAAAERFTRLAAADDATFVAAAQELADRLLAEMDGRSKRGFLVAVQWRDDDGVTGAAALKLDVTDKPGAALGPPEHGTPTLEVVRDLLIELGKLQKGCVTPDARPGSDAVVGDRQTKASQYFLRAMGLQQHEPAGTATLELVRVIAEVAPDVERSAAVAIAGSATTTAEDFFAEHPDLLTDEQRDDVLDRVRQRPRPIVDIAPEARILHRIVEVDGIVIRGPVTTIEERLRVEETTDGIQIVIEVSERPHERID